MQDMKSIDWPTHHDYLTWNTKLSNELQCKMDLILASPYQLHLSFSLENMSKSILVWIPMFVATFYYPVHDISSFMYWFCE
jgi:hypothetical protein